MFRIRQFAADLRATRLQMGRVELPSERWFYSWIQQWLSNSFRPLKSISKEHKRASAERAPDIEAWFRRLKVLYGLHNYTPCRLWGADEMAQEGDAASRQKVQVPRRWSTECR